ncbi:MAG: XRE family transcriptional regulator [Candidatus Diapherotrites archaeon]|nr:XRE family transcriptional regulator [Candidatus Diapherotrites archaeon]
MFKCEFSARFVLPRIRVALARELHSRGFSVTQIARMLETSPAAVSQYLSGKRGKDVPDAFKEDVRRLAERLAAGEDISEDLCNLCGRIRDSGYITA